MILAEFAEALITKITNKLNFIITVHPAYELWS